MPRLSTEEVRALLDAERERVLTQLQALARKNEAAREKERSRRRKFHSRVRVLFVEGKELGLPVTEMAKAVGVTRQMAHVWLRGSDETP